MRTLAATLFAAVIFWGGITAYADSFMSPEPFEIWSEDGTAVFRWTPEYDGGRPLSTAQAGVYQNGELIYSVENLPTMGVGELNFMFSADLRHFVFRPSAGGQVVALGFFEDGVLLRGHRVDELVRDMNVVTYSVTMAFWENWEGRSFDAEANTLTIVTLDGITYVFDITTGEIIYDTAGGRPFVPPGEDSNSAMWFSIKDSELPLWAQQSIEIADEPDLFPVLYAQDLETAPQEPELRDAPPLPEPPPTWRSPLILAPALVLSAAALTLIIRLRTNRRR